MEEGRRIMAVRDGRNPYGSRGGYVVSSRGRGRGRRGGRRDRGMDYASEDMRMRDYGDMTRRGRYGDYGDYNMDMARGGSRMDRGDYNQDMRRDMNYDMRSDMGDMARGYDRAGQDYGYDGHHMGRQGGYEPVEFMGYCSGYYGSPNQDYGRRDMREYRGGRDYGYDMRGGRDYGDDYGDYGETLSEEELKEWQHKLLSKLNDQEKQAFNKDVIMQKIKNMGLKMEGFSEKELYVNTLANYTDHKKSIGMNPDLSIKLAYDDFCDDDSEYQGAEWLAVYFDTFVNMDK